MGILIFYCANIYCVGIPRLGTIYHFKLCPNVLFTQLASKSNRPNMFLLLPCKWHQKIQIKVSRCIGITNLSTSLGYHDKLFKCLIKALNFCKCVFIGTEGAPRRPLTYDNHPFTPIRPPKPPKGLNGPQLAPRRPPAIQDELRDILLRQKECIISGIARF